MKKNRLYIISCIYLILFILIITTDSSSSAENKINSIGIVTASKLICREKPDIKSNMLTSYHFGTPIHIVQRSLHKSKIDNHENYWYQDNQTKGWLYGSYMIIQDYDSNKIGEFRGELIRCNFGCGGYSCAYIFSPLLINEYYIASVFLADYPQNDTDPLYGIIIGKYKKNSNSIEFYHAEKLGAYTMKKQWISFEILNSYLKKSGYYKDYKAKIFISNYDSYFKHFKGKFIYVTEDKESFYIEEEENNNFRSIKSIKEKCSQKDFIYSITIHRYKKLTIPEIQKKFPLY